jgi:hypothetical protein
LLPVPFPFADGCGSDLRITEVILERAQHLHVDLFQQVPWNAAGFVDASS